MKALKPVFEMHAHHLFKDNNLDKIVEIFKEEMAIVGVKKICFLSVPQEFTDKGELKEDLLQNIKVLYLKDCFLGNGYAYSGLVHDFGVDIIKEKKSFLRQVENYFSVGFDGMKMLEGYPTFVKYSGLNVDNSVYDDYYSFCGENNIPITMHIANPDSSWGENAPKELVEMGRVYDSTFPTKKELTDAVFNVMNKHKKLNLTLAHCGFFSEHYDLAERFLGDYINTRLDITPGGEQLITMSKSWDKWEKFFVKYQDKIQYGTDFYPFYKNENFDFIVRLRPFLIRDFFSNDGEKEYLGEKFFSVKIDENVLEKIFMLNAEKLLKKPKEIDTDYVRNEVEKFEKINLTDFDKYDLNIIKEKYEKRS